MPPPPPQPDLMAPPGYTAYTAAPIAQVPLKRVRGVARVTMILVIVSALLTFVELAVQQSITDEAEEYLAGTIDGDEFRESLTGYAAVGLVVLLVQIAAIVLTIIWMFRVAKNHRTLHRGGTWGPGWAIAGWILPPFIFVIPMLMLAEMWKASDPEVRVGGDWRSTRASPLPFVWMPVWAASWIVSIAADAQGSMSLGATDRTLAESITRDPAGDIAVAVLNLVAGIIFAVLVRQMTTRHAQLTGEAAA